MTAYLGKSFSIACSSGAIDADEAQARWDATFGKRTRTSAEILADIRACYSPELDGTFVRPELQDELIAALEREGVQTLPEPRVLVRQLFRMPSKYNGLPSKHLLNLLRRYESGWPASRTDGPLAVAPSDSPAPRGGVGAAGCAPLTSPSACVRLRANVAVEDDAPIWLEGEGEYR